MSGATSLLRVLGSPRRLCDGLNRRDLLHIGGLGLAGLGLADALRQMTLAKPDAASKSSHFGRAKQCIFLYLYGAASQLETFDVKPQSPVEIRGELGAIDTCLPGVQIGELLPETAKVLDRVTVVRSMTHPYPLHASAYTLTSNPQIDVPMQMNPKDVRHWPFIGSLVDFLDEQQGKPAGPLPRNIGLPWQLSSRREYAAGDNSGPYAAFLGSAYDPIWTEFEGEALRTSTYTFGNDTIQCRDPYGPIRPDCRFSLSANSGSPSDLTLDRLHRRRSLLAQFDDSRRSVEKTKANAGFDRFQDLAFSYLTSPELGEALDIRRETDQDRERYGMTLFGQSCLVARRLAERGSKFVTVFWDEFGLVNSAWDTHFYHYSLLREQLCPGLDRALSALILDLEARGLLDETLVVCTTEHGRTPKMNRSPGGGRDHWPRAYSTVLAGAGVARGKVVGRTDAIAAEVVDTPISPKDILATVYYLMGIDPNSLITDRLGRPLRLAGEGNVRPELLA